MDLKNIMDKIDRKYKITFLSAIILGIASHGVGMFNKFSFHDDLYAFSVGSTYTSGRWMLDIFEKVERILFGDGHYNMPLFNGLVALVCIAIAACLIVRLIDLKNDWSCILVGGLMTSFPVITGLFGYVFTLHAYMIALLMAVTGVFLVCAKEKWYYYVIGIILMGCSVGIYQAFIPMIVSCMLLYLINGLSDSESDGKSMFIKACKLAGSAICFMAFYLIVNKLYLAAHNAELASYEGISGMGVSSAKEYLIRIAKSYIEYVYPLRASEYRYYMYPGTLVWIYYAVIVLSLILSAVLVVRLFKKDKFKAVSTALLMCLMPLCTNFVFVMAPRGEVHTLMVYAQIMPFILFAWLVERVKFEHETLQKTISIIAIIIIVSTGVMYCRYDNKCYLKTTYAQQEAISYFTTMVTQIKSVEGYNDEMPVVYVNPMNNQDKTIIHMEELESIHTIPYYGAYRYLNDYNWVRFVKTWCGFDPQMADESEFVGLSEVQAMPSYPDYGSIKVINGTVVVKF